ncbi:MAG: rhodanese-like domain-containing protein [Verrucomicrobia bacterium]|nr:rhodanese-like domain-containing protein [Verrucomicrobiota bacterium]
MKTLTGKQIVRWNVAALAVGLVPLALYWFLFARAPSLPVEKTRSLLALTDSGAALVDVRSAASYAANHVPGAIHWPYESISVLSHSNDLPAALRDKTLLLMCESGLSGALAVNKLRSRGVGRVFNVSGGMQSWLTHGEGKKSELPFRAMSRFEQWLTVFVAFGLKPVYMVLSLALIVWLWRQRATDLAMLRWGLIWFWVGENGCSIDFLFFARGSDFWEYVHGYGMAVGFSMVVFALLEGFDWRVIKFSPEKERCAALNLCRTCFKHAEAPCGLKRLFLVMIPAFALLSAMPLCARLNAASYDTTILGTVHNYCHMMSSQMFEWRFCAGLALVLFVASWLALKFKRHEPVAASKVLFAAAMGPLSFGMLRMFFVSTFADNLMWFDVWEEITEFLFVLGTGAVLWVFRERLFEKKNSEPQAPQAGVCSGA